MLAETLRGHLVYRCAVPQVHAGRLLDLRRVVERLRAAAVDRQPARLVELEARHRDHEVEVAAFLQLIELRRRPVPLRRQSRDCA